ncbi:MAG: hypothetical protein WDM70_11470 [Nitrosomonadales bacterium]
MSNEEQEVLDFFTQEENLPLALSVAEQVDSIRQRMNNAFWRALYKKISTLLEAHRLLWVAELTEDRNTPEGFVGINLHPMSDQELFLRLMIEQQYIGEDLRIYYGVMWSSTPTPDKSRLAEVSALSNALQNEGFKNNENYLAWNWTIYHPRRKDFLLRYSTAADALLDEVSELLSHLMLAHGDALYAANEAVSTAPRSMAVSLDQLRSNIAKAP